MEKKNTKFCSEDESKKEYLSNIDSDAIVISGIAGSFPNCDNVNEYEYNLYNKIDMVSEQNMRWRPVYSEVPKRGGTIRNIEKFDATFFGVHSLHADSMDPQARVLLERAYEVVLDAGVNPTALRGTKTGVYIGTCTSETEVKFFNSYTANGFSITGCSHALFANRISYALGLIGPSFALDTACSSSMYALNCAYKALRNGEIDAAIVGGANLTISPLNTLQFAKLGVLASDGYCRPFDNKASGYTRSEAICVIFLQRKRDAKRIYAELVHSKINCDGFKPEGITFPSGVMQGKLLNDFYHEVDISPNDLGFMEAHSTGTVVGDPEECHAIDVVLCSKRTEPLPIGSVKSSIGHTEPASGVCSIIKVCLAAQNSLIPPNINFESMRETIPALVEGRLEVVTEVRKLEKPYVGVNGFGFGGANAHALLKAHDVPKKGGGIPEDDIPRLVLWAGRTQEGVDAVFDKLERSSLDAEYIALINQIHCVELSGMVFRGFGVFSKNEGDTTRRSICENRNTEHYTGIKRPSVWVFSGMGSQWSEMATALLTIPMFRRSIEECHEILLPFNLNLIDIVTSKDPLIYENIIHCFVGIAAIQIALVDMMKALKLEPDYIIGHSVGELACGYADGCLTKKQMILSAYYRGKVSLDTEKIQGSMAAVGLGYQQIKETLPETIEVACHNSAESCTISGPANDVRNFVDELKARNIFAKEVPCANIPYHSRYIAQMGPTLLKYLKSIVTEPKARSTKWLSSSVPIANWNDPGQNLCSAEYMTNNLLSSVLFEETFATLPTNSLTTEFAPHGLLQAILRRSMTEGIHIPLTQRGHKNNSIFFLSALGKMFSNGLNFEINKLYPEIKFPVSRGTPNIGALMKWDHSLDWYVAQLDESTKLCEGVKNYTVGLKNVEDQFIAGHMIDGKILVPATMYLTLVWETFSMMVNESDFSYVPVQFEDIRFLRATNIVNDDQVILRVIIQNGTGNFEITETGNVVVTGRITKMENIESPSIPNYVEDPNSITLNNKDFYKELKLRGYHYNGLFRGVKQARTDGKGQIEWKSNWASFIDTMLQIYILAADSRSLLLPTQIGRLCINSQHHLSQVEKLGQDDVVMDVFMDRENNRIVSGGIEIENLEASLVQRRKPPGIPVLEKYQFLPLFPAPELSYDDAVRIAVQLSLECAPSQKMRIVELDTCDAIEKPMIPYFAEAIEDLPLITGEFILLSEKTHADLKDNVQVEHKKIETQTNCHFIVFPNLSSDPIEPILDSIKKSLAKDGIIIIRQPPNCMMNSSHDISNLTIPPEYRLISVIPVSESKEILLILQFVSASNSLDASIIEIREEDVNFTWIEEVNDSLKDNKPAVLYSFNEKQSGLIGLVNCLRKEPGGSLISCFYIDDASAPPFNLTHPLYQEQYARGMAINVYRNGQWGSYRHLILKSEAVVEPRTDNVFANILHRGDLSTLCWMNDGQATKHYSIRKAYAAINFRDIMISTGRLQMEDTMLNRLQNEYVMGMEFSGIDIKTGRRVMCMVMKGGISSYQVDEPDLVLEVPDHWSLLEAATVPVVYFTVYYAFFGIVDIRKGKSILIHAGTGGVGIAAIRTALAYNLEVFTTCSTPEKKAFLLEMFPQLKESHIGNSRDTSFEAMIRRETNGKGVDFVLNSLAEEKLHASIRCVANRGHFLEIGKFDLMNDTKMGIKYLMKEITVHGVLADNLINDINNRSGIIEYLKNLIRLDIANGTIKPLPATVYLPTEIEKAFRFMGSGKHIGKVIIQLREEENAVTLPMRVIERAYFNPHMSYIIPGGLGGFGLELADWMVLRGARKIVLSSRRGLTQGYQEFRIALWKSYGTQLLIDTSDISTKTGCLTLLKHAESLGPIGGIFNLAVLLRDGIFANQSKELFVESFAPKATATKFLDELSRALCPYLEYFVVFSSVSCGRGNAGQTNYGMANSVMERIIENRLQAGYPGKAIQWGAVGEVGLVAAMAEDKIDYEIGGTLQQRIASCLQELDVLLMTPDPLVASMVVAEKHAHNAVGLIETVMNIMCIRDLKSITLSSTLSELGMDSLSAVEIKQRLERDFDLVLTPQELRSLTFQKLQEYTTAKNSADSRTTLLDANHADIELLFRNLGDQTVCDEVLLPLNYKESTESPMIIIPGIEGTANQIWYELVKNINSNAIMLQLYKFADLETSSGIADAAFKYVRSVLNPAKPFYIVAYSFGALVAIEIVAMLEQTGFNGQLICIDGAPRFLHKLATGRFTPEDSELIRYDVILSTIVSQTEREPKLNLLYKFQKCKSVEEKLEKFNEYVDKQKVFSKAFVNTMLRGLFNRLQLVIQYNYKGTPHLKSPIVLIRPKEVSVKDIADDYCLSEITTGKIEIETIEGNHASILENSKLSDLINHYHPRKMDWK